MRGAAALALLLAAPLAAQEPAVLGVAAEGDTVRVGEPFRAGVLLRAPGAAAVGLALREPVDRAVQLVEEARAYPEPGPATHRVVATLVVWTVDPPASVPAEARVTGADGAVRALAVELPLPPVRAVLPADSTEPRPPRDIVPLAASPGLPWRWLVLAALLLLLALLAAAWWRRRRRPPAAVDVPDPRTRALAELDALRAEGLVEAGALDAFYARLSRIVRDFAAPAVGTDLTTPEAVALLARSGARAEEVEPLATLLAGADRAKFARFPPPPERAAADWEAARRWIEGTPPVGGEAP